MNQAVRKDGAEQAGDRALATKVPGKKTATSKQARLEALLKRHKGATIAQLERSLGWQPHTVRAAISRLRKAGAEVRLDRSGRVSAYRIISSA